MTSLTLECLSCNKKLKGRWQKKYCSQECFNDGRSQELKRVFLDCGTYIFLKNGKKIELDSQIILPESKIHINTLGYAQFHCPKKRKNIRLHRFVLNYPDGIIDHIDRNPLNNRKSNLRVCGHLENSWNQHSSRGKSPYKGVNWKKSKNKWIARIQVNRKRIYLGYFDDDKDAAKAYNQAALKYYGEYAFLNDIS